VKIRTIAALTALAAVCAAGALAAPASARTESQRPARIVGGVPAAVDTAPWTAFLVAHNRSGPNGQFCGATVATPTAVITAAHCVLGTRPGEFDVVTGRSTLSGSEGQRLPVAAIDIDPGYDPEGTGHDAAVVHLATPTAAPSIAYATAEQAGLAAPGVGLLLTGWGLVANNDDATPDNLQQAAITVQGNRRCRVNYGEAFSGTQMICSLGGLPDACRGDSGGPLVSIAGPTPTLVGIVSFGGTQCGNAHYPGVYTRVSYEATFLAGALSATPPAATAPPTGGASGSYGNIHLRPSRHRSR
jgi:secreted trypsin-like serine protease